MTKREVTDKLHVFRMDLKKHYRVQRLRFLNADDNGVTLVAAFDPETINQVLTRKELEIWLSGVLKCKANVLMEKYVRQFMRRTEDDLILN
ncbi:hypothetical protein EP331_12170 [bacterium]|nr:MAG: hypothetical protein EP331_12170 [bacterium]